MICQTAPDIIIPCLKATSKKQVLMEISRRAAHATGMPDRAIFDAMLARERLGSTAMGDGIAIPHGRVPQAQKVYRVFARLHPALDFDAVDDQPVDMVMALIGPEVCATEHLKTLAKCCRLLRDKDMAARLRGAEGEAALATLLASPEARNAA